MQGPQDEGPRTRTLNLPPDGGWQDDAARKPGYGTLRLQPVMLGPPPEGRADATADDDIDPAELGTSSRTGLLAALAAVALVLAAAGGAFVYFRSTDEHAAAPPLREPAPQAVAPAPAPPPQVVQTPDAGRAAAGTPTGNPPPTLDMGNIESDLIPPSTEGLKPARRVQTILIRVENDREVPANR